MSESMTPEEFFEFMTTDCRIEATVKALNVPEGAEVRDLVLHVPDVGYALLLPVLLAALKPVEIAVRVTFKCVRCPSHEDDPPVVIEFPEGVGL